MTRLSSGLVAFLLAVASCGGGGSDGPDGGGGDGAGAGDAAPIADAGELPASDPFDPATLSAALATAVCDFRDTCEPVFLAYLGTTHEACLAETAASIRAQYDALAPLITDPRVAFSQAGFDRCIAAYEGGLTACALGVDPRECDAIFLGVTPDGAPCSASEECGADGACFPDATGGCSTCRARGAVGESCADTACVAGADCLDAGPGPTCIANTLAVDAPCGTIETGLCRGRLQCVGTGDALTCELPAATGAACDLTGVTADCDIYQSEACDAGGHCVALTLGEVDAPCGEAAPTTLCKAAFTCDFPANQCRPLPADGSPCDDGACAPGAYCDGTTCHTRKPSGTSCGDDDECTAPLFCVDGSCGALAYDLCE